MKNKVLFAGLFPMYNYHHVSELNLMEECIHRGDEVYYFSCDAAFKSCECNREHDLYHCLRCMGMRQAGIGLLSTPVKAITLPSSARMSRRASKIQKQLHSLEDLKMLKIENFDLGMAVYSSLVDQSKSTEPDISEWSAKIHSLLSDALTAYETTLNTLKEEGINLVYVFNGRYAIARAIVRACQKQGVDFYTHERKSDLNKIQLYKNTLPHDPRPYSKLVDDFWEANKGMPEVRRNGVDFFEERPKRQLTGWYSMVSGQTQGKLPASWNLEKRNMTIFGSSEGEFVALQDLYEGALFTSQREGYKELLSGCLIKCPDVMFYLRLHPNSKNEKVCWWKDPALLSLKNLEIIEPEDDICSYTLMNASEKILGIGSSICLEATYWGKPSLLLGLTFYSGIDAVYECHSIEEAYELIAQKDLSPKPSENAVKFGAYMRCAGITLPYSQPVNFYTLTFKGKVLEARQEVHEWLGECESRKPVTGWKKWLRDRKDASRFKKIYADCGGNLSGI